MSDSRNSLQARLPALRQRAELLRHLRAFLEQEGSIEVETPIRLRHPALEDHIDCEASGDQWLRSSPELHMKRLLCAGSGRIHQIGSCFRRGERGQLHHPEYSMLEWYAPGQSLEALRSEVRKMLTHLFRSSEAPAEQEELFCGEPWILSIEQAYVDWAGWNPLEAFDEERFDLDMVDVIEPRLSRYPGPVFVEGFPAERAALARLHPDDPRQAQRWELYLQGLELANAYQELTDADEQRARFERCAAGRRERGQDVYDIDEAFLLALQQGMPEGAGCALGVDRLIMRLYGYSSIEEVLAFHEG